MADHVCILHRGQLKADGTPSYLKRSLGKAFEVVLMSRGEEAEALSSFVNQLLPGCEIVSCAAGRLQVAVARSQAHNLPRLFKAVKQMNAGDESLNRECSVSHTTLEQIFMKVCQMNEGGAIAVVEKGGDDDFDLDEDDLRRCCLCGIRATETVTLYTKIGVEVSASDLVCGPCALGEDVAPPPAELTEHDDGNGSSSSMAVVSQMVQIASSGSSRGSRDETLQPLGGNNGAVSDMVPGPHMIAGNPVREVLEESKPLVKQHAKETGIGLWMAQVQGIMIKNWRLLLTRRKTNIFIFLILVSVLLTLVYGPDGTTDLEVTDAFCKYDGNTYFAKVTLAAAAAVGGGGGGSKSEEDATSSASGIDATPQVISFKIIQFPKDYKTNIIFQGAVARLAVVQGLVISKR